MKFDRTIKTILVVNVICLVFLSSVSVYAQHRGDYLSFQGLTYKEHFDAKSAAMGGANTAIAGELSSLFYNVAGLARIEKFQISVNVDQYNRQWRENQNYYANRQFTSLPFYLEGLYKPLPINSGKWDGDLYKDTAKYLLALPKLGFDPFDEEVAQWKNTKNAIGLKNISIAFPFEVANTKLVAAASYYRTNINDFDRNESHLSPMIQSYDYETNFKRIVNGVDTLNVKWSRFLRQRYGTMNNILAGISGEVITNVMLGVGVKIQNGEADDLLSLKRAGDFHLIDAQKFKFYFVDYLKEISGTSKFSGMSFNLGAMFEISKVKVGAKIDLPYTLTREWNYTTKETGIVKSNSSVSGKDEMKIPLTYNLGVSFQPVDNFLISFNFENAPYTKAEFNFGKADTTFRNWADQNTLAFGVEYKPYDFISVLAGYRSIPEVFIPDGAAIKDKGPVNDSYNCGLSIKTFLGRIDIAYEYRKMKYYDSYYSNANYMFEGNSSLMVGLTYSF